MLSFKINLNSIEGVKDLCLAACKQDGKVTVKSSTYVVDGKSVMGLFSLNLSEPVIVEVEDEVVCEDLRSCLDEYSVR